MGGTTGKAAAPPEAAKAGQKKIARRGGKGWSDLMAAVKMFGPTETMQEFLKKTTERTVRCWWGVENIRNI